MAFTFTIGDAASTQSLSAAITQSTTSPAGANCFTYSLVKELDTSAAFSAYYVTPGTLPASITFGTVNNNEIGTLPVKDIKFQLKGVVNIDSFSPVYSMITLRLFHECTTATLTTSGSGTTSDSIHNLENPFKQISLANSLVST